MEIEALLLRACAPQHLADAIAGDLYERRAALAQSLGETRALAACRAELLRSLPPLIAYRASQSLAENWAVALPVSAAICALCLVTIPFWNHLGMGGGIYHVLRLVAIGLGLACIPRASTLAFAFLIVLIGVSDGVIDASEFGGYWQALTHSNLYQALLVDAVSMAAAIATVRAVSLTRRSGVADS